MSAKDPLPAIVELIGMVDVAHPNDRLAILALQDAKQDILRGRNRAALSRVSCTADTLRKLGTSKDALTALNLAINELRGSL